MACLSNFSCFNNSTTGLCFYDFNGCVFKPSTRNTLNFYIYKVKVKDDVYPTGIGTIEIPINVDIKSKNTNL